MVHTLREAPVRVYHYDDIRALRRHVAEYLAAYNFAKQLTAPRLKTPYLTLQAFYASEMSISTLHPDHFTPEPYTRARGRAEQPAWAGTESAATTTAAGCRLLFLPRYSSGLNRLNAAGVS